MGVHYQCFYRLAEFLARTCFDFRVVHRERIIEEGGAILAMNHESYLDPPLAGIACRREIHYLARKTLLDWPVLGPILPKLNVIPVDQDRADMSALKTVIKLVRAGHSTVIFPEGSRTLDGDFLPALPGPGQPIHRAHRAIPAPGLVIAKTRAPVVPMRIFGARAAFPRGGKPRLFTPITLVVGEPIFFSKADLTGDGRDLYQGLSERVMRRISDLRLEE